MRPSSRLAATWAQRRAPAVCDELGPTMTGPKISNAEVVASVCGLPAICAPVLSRRPEGRGILSPAVPRALVFGRLLGQSCSRGEHIKCSPARAELATDLMPRHSGLRIHGWSCWMAKFISWGRVFPCISKHLHHRLYKKEVPVGVGTSFGAVLFGCSFFRWLTGHRLL